MRVKFIHVEFEGDEQTAAQVMRTVGAMLGEAATDAPVAPIVPVAELPPPPAAPREAPATGKRKRSPEAIAKMRATLAAKRAARARELGDAVPRLANARTQAINPHRTVRPASNHDDDDE